MTTWKILEIKETADEAIIRKAYSLQAAKYHPEEHPDEFKRVQAAYKSAMQYAKRVKKQGKAVPEYDGQDIMNQPMEKQPENKQNESKNNKAQTENIQQSQNKIDDNTQWNLIDTDNEQNSDTLSSENRNQNQSEYNYEYVEKEKDISDDDTAEANSFLKRVNKLYANPYTKNNPRAWELLFEYNASKQLLENQDFVYRLLMKIKDFNGVNREIYCYIFHALQLKQGDKWYDLAHRTFEQKRQQSKRKYRDYSNKMDEPAIRNIIYADSIIHNTQTSDTISWGKIIKRTIIITAIIFFGVVAIVMLNSNVSTVDNPVESYTYPGKINISTDSYKIRPMSSDVLKEFVPYQNSSYKDEFGEYSPCYVDINFDGDPDMVCLDGGLPKIKIWNKATAKYEAYDIFGNSPNIVVDSAEKVLIIYGYQSEMDVDEISNNNKGKDVLYKMYQWENGQFKLIETLLERINIKGYLQYIHKDCLNNTEVLKTSSMISDEESIRYNSSYPKWFDDSTKKVKVGLTNLK